MIEWIILIGIVGFIGAILLLSTNTRNRGSRDHVRIQRTGEKAERKMDRERDYRREREHQRHGRSSSWVRDNR